MTDKSDCPSQAADNLPRDATGRVIPFGTTRLYSWKAGAAPIEVLGFTYYNCGKEWWFKPSVGGQIRCEGYYLDPPDS